MKKRSSLIFINTQALLIIIGLVLIIAGNQIDLHLYKVEIGELLAHIGTLILFIGTLHYLFDFNLRREFQDEIATSILGSTNVHRNGIVDSTANSKEIREEYFSTSEKLIISVGYTLRFVQTHLNIIESRSTKGKETIIVHYNSKSPATDYLAKSRTGSTSIPHSLGILKGLIYHNSKIDKKHVRLIPIDTVLRYSFIYTENFIWIKFYPNSRGIRSEIPAIKFNCETVFYKFFENDILSLVSENRNKDNSLDNLAHSNDDDAI